MNVGIRPDPQRQPLVNGCASQPVEFGAPGFDDRYARIRRQLDRLADALVGVQPRPDVQRERGHRGPQRLEDRMTSRDDLDRTSSAPAAIAGTVGTAAGSSGS